MKRNNFIYYPSLSASVLVPGFVNNTEMSPGITARFYNKENNFEDYYHPYFLVTAGHNYKQKNFKDKFGFDKNVIIMGDSGGYQIATGVIKWNSDLKKTIFKWLEYNSDIAINLDIPTYNSLRRSYLSTFNECLNISIDNFKYFYENQSGNTKFLNVMQGNNEEQVKQWYNRAKDFEFSGWALGNSHKIDKIMLKLAIMVENKEFDKSYNQFLHILGISKLSDFFALGFLQKIFDEMYDGRIIISTDSATPTRGTAFGLYMFAPDYKKGHFNNLTLRNKGIDYVLDAKLPCDCVICKDKTFADIVKFDKNAYNYMALHNLIKMKQAIKTVNLMSNGHIEMLSDILTIDTMNVLKSFEKILTSKYPVKEYYKYQHLYKRIQSMEEMSNNIGLENFLEF